MNSGEEKTEKPTPKKKKESRKEGQVPRTQDLGGWASVLIVGMALPSLIRLEIEHLHALLIQCLSLGAEADTAKALTILGEASRQAFLALVVLGSAVMVIGVAAALAQGGFFLATKMVKPTWSKLNPISGAKRIFGPQAAWEGAKVLIKSALVGLIGYLAIKAVMPMIGGTFPISSVVQTVTDTAFSLIRNIAIAGIFMAGLDYAFQRRRIGKQTRMTKEEIKQEHKQTEGDPLLKSAIRSRQLAAARSRMMASIPEADVVLVNPTHVAVALKYDAEKGAPRVVARGAGAIAAKIRAVAALHEVPLVRDVPLARALYRSTEVGHEIPAELFAAVAQVLAFVISRRTKGQRGGEHRTPRPTEAVPTVLPAAQRRRRRRAPTAAAITPA